MIRNQPTMTNKSNNVEDTAGEENEATHMKQSYYHVQ